MGATLFLGAVVVSPVPAFEPAPPDALLRRAEELESKGQWREAGALYDSLLARERNSPEVREHYQQCLRHIHQARRLRDESFRQAVVGLRLPSQTLKVYEQVLEVLRAHYVEIPRTEPAELFRQGLLELRWALEDPAFVKEYLAQVRPEGIAAFKHQLAEWDAGEIKTRGDARRQAFKVVEAARDAFDLPPAVVVFELVCGACNGLDEYTAFLTPAQLQDLQASLRGRSANVGIELAVVDQRLVICQVHPDSPAARTLKVGDRVLRIDRQPVDPARPGEARARLRGESGTVVEVEVLPAGEMMPPRSLRLERQALVMPSVEMEPEPRVGVGYVRVLCFTETTVQELKDAILRLQAAGMKALVLDLRGNPGGLFKPAVEVAEMFLADGLIVHTQSRQREFNDTVKSHNPNALSFPLVVLIDGDTASAAEVLAGALKENERARLVGQATFGKGSIQWVVPLKGVTAGVRITVARFLSPAGLPYTGRGVAPHLLVELTGEPVDDAQRAAGWREALQMAMMAR